MKSSDDAQCMDVRSKTAWRAQRKAETSVRALARDDAPVADERVPGEREQKVVEDASR